MWVWNNLNILKYSFVSWLIRTDKIKIKGKLLKIGAVDDDKFFICMCAEEIRDYLFFECQFSRRVYVFWAEKMRIRKKCFDLVRLLEWFRKGMKCLRLYRKIKYVSFGSLIYCVWLNRNNTVWESKCNRFDILFRSNFKIVIVKCYYRLLKKVCREDREWLIRLVFV